MKQEVKEMTNVKPVGDRILAKRLEAEETVKGGIILPDTAKKKQETAKVVAVGSGKKAKDGSFIESPVQVGDTILIDKYSGQEVTVNDEEYVIVKFDDIIALIN
jgi:chaperonin GroES